MEPALEIRMVWENLALAMALWTGSKKGMITKDHLPTGNSVVPGAPGTLERVFNPLELRNEQDLARCISNQLRGGVTFSAMLTQRTLDYVFGPSARASPESSPLNEPDPDLRAARCSIYLLSRALSQGMLSPVWDCKGAFRSRFEVAKIAFVLDATELDGKPVYWENIGGLENYLELLGYLADVLEQMGPIAASGVEEPIGQIPMPIISDESLSGFIEARCVLGKDSYTIASDLYQNYLEWCQSAGQDPLVQRSFGIQLTKLGFIRKRRGRGRHWWKGLETEKASV